MAGNVVSNLRKYYGGQVPVPGQGDSDGKVKMLVEKTATIEVEGVQTDVDLLYDADDLTTPVTPQQLGQWTDENYLIVFKNTDADGFVRGFILYALATDHTSTDTLVNNVEFITFKGDMNEPGASAFIFSMVEDSSTLTRYLRDEHGELTVKFDKASVEPGAQSDTLDNLIGTDTGLMRFVVEHEGDNAYLILNTKGLGEVFDDIGADLQYIFGVLDELPSDEHGYFNSSLYTTPGDGTTTNLVIDDFRISADRDVSGENIEFVPTREEGGVEFGNVYLEPGTYILAIQYTLQWVGYPRGTFLPKVCNVADQPFDFSYEHEDVVRVTRIVTRTTRGKLVTNIAIDADTPPMGVWVKNMEVAQVATFDHSPVAHDTTLTGTGRPDSPLGVTPAAFGKIKDIPTSISQFRTGDVIVVDGPNGPAKMATSDLQDAILGGPVDETVQAWLDEHPEATTTVEDHSLTYQKLVNGTLNFVTPEMYGAVGDGVTDDSQSITDAIAAGNIVVFAAKTYKCNNMILVPSNKMLIGTGSTVLKSNGPVVKIGSHETPAENVTLQGFIIDGSDTVVSEYGHGLIIEHVRNCTIAYCEIKNSQGDGVYIAGANVDDADYNSQILITKCNIHDYAQATHNRQGIAIIQGRVTVSQCTITQRDAVAWPIDVEPNNSMQEVNLLVKDCLITGGMSAGGANIGKSSIIIRDSIFLSTSPNSTSLTFGSVKSLLVDSCKMHANVVTGNEARNVKFTKCNFLLVYIGNINDLEVSDCWFEYDGAVSNTPFRITRASEFINIHDCYFKSNSTTVLQMDSVNYNFFCRNNRIERLSGSGSQNGIRVPAGEGAVVVGNSVRNGCQYAISSTKSVVINNTYADAQYHNFGGAGSYVALNRKYTDALPQVSGGTASRPTAPTVGYQYFDTDLGKMIVWNGTAWVNVNGTALS